MRLDTLDSMGLDCAVRSVLGTHGQDSILDVCNHPTQPPLGNEAGIPWVV